NAIISDSSILSKAFLPLMLKYLEINCGLITIYLDSLMDDYKPQFDDITNQNHSVILDT
ncbi:18959_t:CDS:2, partial [Gigaspora margarita]